MPGIPHPMLSIMFQIQWGFIVPFEHFLDRENAGFTLSQCSISIELLGIRSITIQHARRILESAFGRIVHIGKKY